MSTEDELDGDTNCNSYRTIPEWLVKRIEWIGNKRTGGDHPEYCIIKMSKNTEKSARDLRLYAVTKKPCEKKNPANGKMKNSKRRKQW